MAKSLKEMMDSLTPEERSEVEQSARALIEQEHTLRDLRRAQSLTQERLAEMLGIEQDNVSRMERRADMLLSTMSSYVEAMGGKLRLVAEFPNRAPLTIRLSDVTGQGRRPRRGRSKGEKA
ncbi:XRE family transcriptional regulator [bacterium]|nr:XRE family transcriptional regulator [bacterium]